MTRARWWGLAGHSILKALIDSQLRSYLTDFFKDLADM